MKAILKLLLLPLALIILFTQCEKIDKNDPIKIPDAAFLNALIELGVDTDGDGLISMYEAESITSLWVHRREISDLTGIEAFINLDTFSCEQNSIKHLDLSNLHALIYIRCFENELISLDVSNGTDLKNLVCTFNELTQLDLSGNPNLVRLW